MLGRIVPGRLPTTQANIDLVKNRIKQVQYNMTVLDQKVKAGTIDSRQAGYQRRQLIGEVDELRRVIKNSRLSTPYLTTTQEHSCQTTMDPHKLTRCHRTGKQQNLLNSMFQTYQHNQDKAPLGLHTGLACTLH